MVQFVIAIEEHYGRQGMPFEELLMKDGRYVDEIAVVDVAKFLGQHLAGTGN